MSFIPSGTRLTIVTVFGFILLALAFPVAQQTPPTFRTGVEAVVLDVSVLGRDGLPVRGLSAADFTVLEDGRPQTIDTFTAVDLPDVVRTGAAWLREVPRETRANTELNDGAVFVIVLDDIMMSPYGALKAPTYARQVIDGMGPNDLAAVVYIVTKRSGQTFTHDRTRLNAAVDRFRAGGGGGALSVLAPRMLVDTLGDLADGLAALPARRKAIVFISEGLDIDLSKATPESTFWTDVIAAQHLGTTIGDVLKLFDRARRANVSVYCVDPVGLTTGEKDVQIDFLKTLSGNTGGFTVAEINDPQPGITQIFRENASYYIVGYQPANARTDGRFRKIEVRVNRPGTTVRTRSGYFEPGRAAASGAAKRKAPNVLMGAMAGFFPSTDVPMRVTAAPFAAAGGRQAAVAIVLGLQPVRPPGADTTAANSAGPEDVDVLVSAYDLLGTLRGSDRIRARVRLRPGAGDRDTLEVLSRLDLRPGRYQLRLAATVHGKAGSVYHDVEVPDFTASPLSLSGVAITADPAVASAPKDRLRPVIPIVPTAQREFTAGDQVGAFMRVYQGRKEPLSPVVVTTRIVDGRDSEVFSKSETLGADRFGPVRAADYRVTLPLGNLPRGPYLFSITATRGTLTARRDVRITLR